MALSLTYFKKLKAEIDFNEREKKKFKKLYEQLVQAINKTFSDKNKLMTYENFVEIKKQTEISIYKLDSESNIENEFIQVNVENFSINSVYNNLNILTKGEYTYNKILRKKVSNFISNFCINNECNTKKNITILENPYNPENIIKKRKKSSSIRTNELNEIINFQAFSKSANKKRKTYDLNCIKYHQEYTSKIIHDSNVSGNSIKDKNDLKTDKDI